ncbi:cytochrome P450 [Nocardia alni]|uniref:cytochrome P450 n=1 Tax=Nocardia alni TaxID=2815723 RepID=UPI001C21CECD|nr:cytochrome P450 [Nocardia alni]
MTEAVQSCPYSTSDLSKLFRLEPELVRCPYPLYDVLRDEAPVTYDEQLRAWVVTRHDHVVEALRAPETFSSAQASGPSSVTGLAQRLLDDPATSATLRAQATRRVQLSKSPVLLFTDPPLHKRQRLLVSAAFHPRRINLLEPDVRRLTNELIDGFLDAREVELVTQFSILLPMTIIATMLGVPPENMDTFKKWSNAFTAGVGALEQTPEQVAGIFAAVDEFYDYFTEQVEARRSQPRDDLLSDLVEARMEGEQPLTIDEILQMLVQFLVAGNETTTNMITSIMFRLAGDKALQDRVRADPSLIPSLVDEMLRLESPTQGMFRVATKDVVLGGQAIPAGALVFLCYAAANRDPSVFAAPGSVDLDSDRPPHLAFARGEHFCLGINIAKLELRVAVEILLARLDDITLAEPSRSAEYHRSFMLRGLESLPLRFTART